MKIEKSTIIRTILFALVIINFILERCGIDIIPADEYTITMFVEYLIEIGILICGFWYNNSYSPKALKAQNYLKELRNGESEVE